MLPETQSLLDEVESRTGRPLHVMVDRDLDVSATVQIARRGMQQHLLRVRPSGATDYFIANQVIFMLRMLELPASDRFDFAATDASNAAMAAVLRKALSQDDSDVGGDPTLVANFTKWVLMQVRSIPIGMRADQQIFRDMPALRTSLQAGIREQNETNLSAIQRLQGMLSLPERYLWPAAAYALFTDRLTGGSLYAIPFEAMGLGRGGRELLRLYDAAPSTPDSDRALVDTWAGHLALGGWYRWIPYQP